MSNSISGFQCWANADLAVNYMSYEMTTFNSGPAETGGLANSYHVNGVGLSERDDKLGEDKLICLVRGVAVLSESRQQ